MTEISVLVPIFNEVKNIPLLSAALCSVLNTLDKAYEVIFIDDGSTDGSFEALSGLAAGNRQLKVIRFMRNFGQTAAISAGVDCSRGKIIILMDGDLQNDPADIPNLLKNIEAGYDVVSGWRRRRRDPFFSKKVPSYLANKLIAGVTGLKLHDFGCTLKAYRREAIEKINFYGEVHRFLPVIAFNLGYRVIEVEVAHHKRSSGKSKYGFSRIFRVALDLPILFFSQNYSLRPNYMFGGWGLILVFVSGVAFAWTTYYQIQRGVLFSLAIFTIGIQLFLLGLILEMIIRIHAEAVAKKTYVIKTIINSDK